MTSWLWTLIGWSILIWGLTYILTAIAIGRSRFNYMRGAVVESDRVPLYLRDLFELAAAEIQPLGFRECGYIEYTPFNQLPPAVRWMQVFVDSSNQHFVTIDLRYPVSPTDPFSITFYTWFDGGHLSMTLDRLAYAIVRPMLDTTIGDCRVRNLERQWTSHRQQCAKLDRPMSKLELDDFCDRYFTHFSKYLDGLIARKIAFPTDDGTTYKLGINKILSFTYQLLTQKPKAQPLARPIALPPEIALDNARLIDRMQTPTSTNPRRKFWLFGISAVAFYIATIPAMGWLFGIQLSAIVLLHELGHLSAMKLFGYRDTNMLFVPFLGGVAMGKNEDAKLWQKFWVLMLGPLPGILLGMTMLFVSRGNAQATDWYMFGLWMVGINLLNLLPIYPLDGGRIVSLLLQSYPELGFIFKIACAILSIGIGLMGTSLFLVISVAILMSLPIDISTARAINQLKTTPGDLELGKEEWFKWAYDRLNQNWQLPAKPGSQKIFIDNLWEWRLNLHDLASIRWGLGLFYCVTLIGGTIGGGYGLFGRNLPGVADSFADDFQIKGKSPSQIQAYYQQKWQHELQANTAIIDREPNNVAAHVKQLKLHRLLRDTNGEMVDLDRLVSLQPGRTQYLQQRLFLKQKLHRYNDALFDASRILERDPRSQFYIYRTIGDLYVKLNRVDLAISSYTTHLQISKTANYHVYLERSKLYAKIGKKQLALADLTSAIASQPKYASVAYLERAKLRDLTGDRPGANADRQTAAEIEAKNRERQDEEDL